MCWSDACFVTGLVFYSVFYVYCSTTFVINNNIQTNQALQATDRPDSDASDTLGEFGDASRPVTDRGNKATQSSVCCQPSLQTPSKHRRVDVASAQRYHHPTTHKPKLQLLRFVVDFLYNKLYCKSTTANPQQVIRHKSM